MAQNVHIEQINTVKLPAVADMEDRGLSFCETPIRAVATLENADLDKNSRLSLAYKLGGITVMLERQSDGVEIVAPGLPITFPHQSDAVGFIIDWRQLTRTGPMGTELAQDCYRVRIDWNIGTTTGSFYECSIELLQYNNMNTEGYCNVFVVLNDLVKKQGINYKDSGFASTLMFKGQFGFMQPNYLTTNNIYSSDDSRRKIDIKAIRTYELRTNQLLSCITQQLDEEYLLAANQIYITDWNANNHIQNKYTSYPVILSKDESPSFEYGQSVYATMKGVFKDKQQLHESKYSGDIKGSDNIILELPTVIGTPIPPVISGTGCPPIKDGQTVSYRLGDAGSFQAGSLVDWFTLSSNNFFGNPNRFTDEFGTQIYASGVVIDWSTWDGTNVMGWDKSHSAGTHIWNAAVDNALLESIGTFTTGWRLPNFQEFVRICYSGSDRFLNYAPFYFASNNCFHTGATYFGLTTQDMIVCNQQQVGILASSKAAARNYKACRVFTTSGTVLT